MQAFSSHDIFQTLYQQIMLLELKPGSTLRENGLEVVEDVMPISARLIVNMACMKLRKAETEDLIARMVSALGNTE